MYAIRSYYVVIALLPALVVAFYVFGIRAITVTLLSVIVAMLSEAICQKIMGRDLEIFDGSAVITGILFAFVIPTTMPYLYVAIGAMVSVVLGKMLFGGLGHNIFNPALVGRAFITASWPVVITSYSIHYTKLYEYSYVPPNGGTHDRGRYFICKSESYTYRVCKKGIWGY